MTEKTNVNVSHRFKASAEDVFDAWLQPDKVRAWMGAALQTMGLSGEIGRIEIDPQVGGKFLFTDMRDGTEARHWGKYLELARPGKIAYTWIVDPSEESDPSKVTIEIQPEDDGCVATLVHEMDAKWTDYIAQTENGWSSMMRAMDALLETGPATS